jgi:hypothetical protein
VLQAELLKKQTKSLNCSQVPLTILSILGTQAGVSSPDSKYWGGSHIGRGRGPLPATASKLFFPLWTEDELGWAAPFLFPMMELDMVNARFRLLSGVPRHMELTDEYGIKTGFRTLSGSSQQLGTQMKDEL